MFFLPKPPADRAPFVTVARHLTLGYTLVPHQDTFTFSEPVRTNSDGLRERELDRVALQQSRVVLCLGGSETFGKGVAVEKTFARRLEERLKQAWPAPTPPFVINAGVPDYTLEQSLRFLAERVEDLRPEAVVLSFYWDDLLGLSPPGAKGAERRDWSPRAWARRRSLLERLAPIYSRSRILCLVKNRLKVWSGRRTGNPGIVWKDAILENRSLEPLEAAWSRAGDLLKVFAELSSTQGFHPVVLVLPVEQQVGRQSAPWFQERVKRIAEAASLPVVDPLPRLEQNGSFASLFLPYDGRPNEKAHEILAEELAEFLKDR